VSANAAADSLYPLGKANENSPPATESRETYALGQLERAATIPAPGKESAEMPPVAGSRGSRQLVEAGNSGKAPAQEVHIGEIDVIVEAPRSAPGPAAPAAAETIGSLSSRLYLRRLG
jgi:hypothetical protein